MAAIPSATLTGQIGMPLDLGVAAGGVHAYGELDDSFSFYRGIHPSHQLLELSGDLAPGAWSLSPPITCITIPMAMCRRRAGTG